MVFVVNFAYSLSNKNHLFGLNCYTKNLSITVLFISDREFSIQKSRKKIIRVLISCEFIKPFLAADRCESLIFAKILTNSMY